MVSDLSEGNHTKAGFSLPSLVGAGAGAGEWASTTAGETMANSRPKIATTPITAIDEEEKEPAIFSPSKKKLRITQTNNFTTRERERKKMIVTCEGA